MNSKLNWTLRIIPALILLQTLPFKFGGAEESKNLFSELTGKALGNPDLEAFARLGTGVVELIAIVLLLIPKYSRLGAFITVGTLAGALMGHVAFLGFAGDYGKLAALAVVALVAAAILFIRLGKTPKAA